jgi:nucleoredoxin
VFVSVDGNQAAFDRHYATMPWFAIDYTDTARIASLKQRYGINGLPTLVLLDSAGHQVLDDGRQEIMNHGIDALGKWEAAKVAGKQPVQ